jgi:hypothetical protein
MKLTDLNFKILTPTPERARKLLAALTKAGIRYAKYATEPTAITIKKGHFGFWRSLNVEGFDKDPMPEVTFAHALELLAQVEAPTPTFDIKLRDEVLCRRDISETWEFRQFTRTADTHFRAVSCGLWQQMVKYKGNEHLHGTTDTPDGWWEVESGQPVWRRK